MARTPKDPTSYMKDVLLPRIGPDFASFRLAELGERGVRFYVVSVNQKAETCQMQEVGGSRQVECDIFDAVWAPVASKGASSASRPKFRFIHEGTADKPIASPSKSGK